MNYKSLVGFKIIFFILLIGFSEASENQISIDPVGLGQDGLYEINLSGERFSGECEVMLSRYHVFYPDPDLFGGGPYLRIWAYIMETNSSSGKCSFSTTMTVYLPPSSYQVVLLTSTNNGPFEVAEFASNWETDAPGGYYHYFYSRKSPLPIDIQNVNAEISAPDSFTLRNILVPGYEDTYWGEFKWNPNRLSFDLENAGVD